MSDSIGERVQHVVSAALDKKAFDLDVLDVSKLTTLGDYFIICSGSSFSGLAFVTSENRTTRLTTVMNRPSRNTNSTIRLTR